MLSASVTPMSAAETGGGNSNGQICYRILLETRPAHAHRLDLTLRSCGGISVMSGLFGVTVFDPGCSLVDLGKKRAFIDAKI